MKRSFVATIKKDEGSNATGIQVPPEVVEAFGKGKKPPVKVTLNAFTYQTTVAVMGGDFYIPLSAERRNAAGVKGGDVLEITLELDTEPRTVTLPADLAEALAAQPGVLEAFNALAYSHRKEYVRWVEEAKAIETRTRRIKGVIEKIQSNG
jgi:hypothetical protein